MSELRDYILKETAEHHPVQALTFLCEKFPGKITFSTSFGWEDQVITHMIFTNKLPIKVFTLETAGFSRRPIMCGTVPWKCTGILSMLTTQETTCWRKWLMPKALTFFMNL